MEESQIYSPKTLEFITVASEYCKALEHCREFEQHEFIDVMRNLLPMVYLKVSLIGEIEEADGYNEPKVTEDDYNYVRSGVAAVLAEKDVSLCLEDCKCPGCSRYDAFRFCCIWRYVLDRQTDGNSITNQYCVH